MTSIANHEKVASSMYERNGYYIGADVFTEEEAEKAYIGAMEVLSGKYNLAGEPSWGKFNPEQVGTRLVKVNDAHIANQSIRSIVCSPELGKWSAAITGALMVQVFATQLIHKPSHVNASGNIGWHQDRAYWKHMDGNVFTAWVAFSNVMEASGPMIFVKGSHQWGEDSEANNFEDKDLLEQKSKLLRAGRIWEEDKAILRPGQASFHHRLTIHGSGPNISDQPRLAIAIHMRTEDSEQQLNSAGSYYHDFSDLNLCPIIYGGVPNE